MRLKLFGGIGPLNRRGVLHNVLAGVTLASMNIPQVLGYAQIAGMPVATGLYSVFLPLVMFASLRFEFMGSHSRSTPVLQSSPESDRMMWMIKYGSI